LSAQVPQLKELLRLPVEEGETGVRAERAAQVESLHGDLAELVFAGATDWVDQDDGWLAERLAARLAPGQGEELLSALAGDGDAALTYLANVCVTAWEADDGTDPADDQLTGTDNGANWAANRLPGTLYFAHDGTDYRYSDRQRAPAAEWRTLDERVKDASDRAQPWGAGWCTPAGEDSRYGDDYVYAVDRNGPWLTQAEVERLLTSAPEPAQHAEPGQQDGDAQPWADVWAKPQDGQWRYGLTAEGPFAYEDGELAQRDKAVLDEVTTTLHAQYPDADVEYVRAMAAQYVTQTA
jgi:hypothetical protein